jgi:hypothetical protein
MKVKLPKIKKVKMTRIRKLRIAEIASLVTYAVGVGLFAGSAHAEGYQEGFDAGVKAMADAYALHEDYKEDENEKA